MWPRGQTSTALLRFGAVLSYRTSIPRTTLLNSSRSSSSIASPTSNTAAATSLAMSIETGGPKSDSSSSSSSSSSSARQPVSLLSSSKPGGGTCLRTFVDGNASGPTVVFVHGWPDDHTMWDKQVAHLKDRFRCVTTDLPGFSGDDIHAEKWGYSMDEVVKRLERTVEVMGDGRPVFLVAHDWGCTYSYMLEKKRPDLVRKLVAIDVGGAIEPSVTELLFIMSYHLWLITAFGLGGPVGDAMSRFFARVAGAPLWSSVARATAGYPYHHWWKRKFSKDQEKIPAMMPEAPVLFLYGTAGSKKLLTFHADWWAQKLNEREGSSSVAMTGSGHWVTHDQPDEVNRRLDDFLSSE